MKAIINRLCRAVCCLAVLAVPAAVFAANDATVNTSVLDKFGIYGFLSQGYLLSDHNNYFGKSSSNHGTFDFREIGVGAAGNVTDNLRLSGLLLSRKAGETDNGDPRIDHLIFDYSLLRSENNNLGIVGGRFKLQFGFYNDTRDVPAARPSILLPQAFYYDNARKFLATADGLRLYDEHYGGDSVTKYSLDIGRTTFIDNPETRLFLLGSPIFKGHLNNDISYAGRIYHSINGGKTQFVGVLSNQRVDYEPTSTDILPAGSIYLTTLWLSAQQELGEFTFTSEVFMPKADYRGFGPIIKDKTVYPLGYYVQATYTPSPKWEAFVRYDVAYTDKHDRDGVKLSASSGRPPYAFYAKDFTFGARYRFTKNLDLSGEFHTIKGTAWLPIADNPSDADTVRDWHLLALQITYHF